MKRRDFLMTSAKTVGAAATPWGWQTQRPAESKADRIAIMASIENEQQGDPYENVQKVYDIVVANI